MTQLIAQIKLIAIGDGIHPSNIYVVARVTAAFVIGVITASLLI